MLHEFVTANRAEIIGRCKTKVALRSGSTRSDGESNRGIPVFLDQLVDELRIRLSDSPSINQSAIQHGGDLRRQGYNVSQVVHNYGDVCQSITEMAVERNTEISSDDFRMLNRCLDDAIAGAVTEFGRKPDLPPDAGGGEEVSPTALARELANSIDSAIIAFDAIKGGSVGLTGSTGRLLDQRLVSAHNLTKRLLVELAPPSSTVDSW